MRAAALTAIGDKRRPIACAGVLRRIMSSTVARIIGTKLGPELQKVSQFRLQGELWR